MTAPRYLLLERYVKTMTQVQLSHSSPIVYLSIDEVIWLFSNIQDVQNAATRSQVKISSFFLSGLNRYNSGCALFQNKLYSTTKTTRRFEKPRDAV